MKKFILIILVVTAISLYVLDIVGKLSLGNKDSTQKNIYFGQTLDLEYNLVSMQYFKGIELAYQYINRRGGVNGYKINVVLLNDKYERDLAVKNANLLVDYYNVLALVGTFGTQANLAIIDEVVNKKRVPLIGPCTGSVLLRSSFNKNIIFTLGSVQSEFDLMIENILSNKITNIGIIYQNDDYGISFLNSFINNILSKKLPLNVLNIASYEKNSQFLYDTFQKLFSIKKPYLVNYNGPDNTYVKEMQAVVLFCVDLQIATILGTIKRMNPNMYIYYNTFVGDNKSNYKIVKDDTANIYQTMLTYDLKSDYPTLYKMLIEEVDFYNKSIDNYNVVLSKIKKIDDLSNMIYYGFYTGLLVIEVLKKFKSLDNISREDFINKFYEVKDFDIFGLKIGPFIINKNNQGINFASINKIVKDELVMIKEIDYNKKNFYSEENNIIKQENNIVKQENNIIKQEYYNVK